MNLKSSFKDKNILVLGASSGIGIEICEQLLKNEAKVILHYHSNDSSINVLLEKYPLASKVQFNINDETIVKKEISDLYSKYSIEIFINCVGIMVRGFIPLISKKSFSKVINTNLVDAFVALKYVALHMIKLKKGVIINISSLAGQAGLRGQSAYSASKAGLDALTRIAAKELANYNIRVNGVAPGYINTGILEKPTEQDLEYTERIPLKRFGKGCEVAYLIEFLASDYSSYINGQTIIIDGGLSINL